MQYVLTTAIGCVAAMIMGSIAADLVMHSFNVAIHTFALVH